MPNAEFRWSGEREVVKPGYKLTLAVGCWDGSRWYLIVYTVALEACGVVVWCFNQILRYALLDLSG